MAAVNFQQWIQHPETLNRDTLYELRNLLARYPYFQSLRLLYLKNLYILHDISFGGELRKAVLCIADRRKLFRLIEGERYEVLARKKGVLLTEVLKEEPSVDRTLALIDAFLSTVPEEMTAQTSLDYSMDYTSYLLEETPAAEQLSEETPKLKGFELIDNFIEKSESDSPLCMKPLREETPSSATSPDDSSEEKARGEEEVDDSCFTETLAKIYVKQRRYSKALEIIKKLSLKYPKKNAYFADQIRFLEKLIINANSK
ncbi:tetratricopeptide repeat protein [Bacteroides sp. AN502(2024)]|uniref:tetratricopeptide repeat protein n=1 Tax=Bacteroides sp. AN502(2024) TaxID=3160599 RepID=UPI003513E50D